MLPGSPAYLVGFCHHAQAERTFRLDRIKEIELVAREKEDSTGTLYENL
ncbi:MAG: hypothetical protein DPW09_20585 [Anaerolineae bacterium]|nr:WYL domain-containing protein [Anaerolineales bacterium]MCQ3975840.1 hypothetical protein [Anaerolineae bacterium]